MPPPHTLEKPQISWVCLVEYVYPQHIHIGFLGRVEQVIDIFSCHLTQIHINRLLSIFKQTRIYESLLVLARRELESSLIPSWRLVARLSWSRRRDPGEEIDIKVLLHFFSPFSHPCQLQVALGQVQQSWKERQQFFQVSPKGNFFGDGVSIRVYWKREVIELLSPCTIWPPQLNWWIWLL